jgi:outer membrane murein-binding lipoprotein Lpp
MKRAIVAGAVVASLALAGPASAATPTERKLQREVNTLKRDVAALKTQVRQLRNGFGTGENQQLGVVGLNEVFGLLAVLQFCSTALSADAFKATWAVMDQKPGGPTIGPQQDVNEGGACNAMQVTRSSASPPSLAPFHAFYRVLQFRTLFGGGF